ncbi:glycerophosphodiester phosphodiesterase family protein [Streptomyces sp. DSM 44915]|uniref:Glycerophosphodiester phosphodiesterase family protein n=1 Tax=Streptomyces chisholmiae TaxID=3075540 RepID=A0ABU2JQA7_9ACTN|nr:glycerophosphodiester phosphodiesterase family protein [Streptomyces sp. DSM 44915]MDT0267182.1 glycerophosphodiester phosphodiesterase family protein [Streptomyces sp. DSM 44915]
MARVTVDRSRIAVIAHRGASEDAPEHSLAAYRRAIEDGADGLECDVRLTADGHLVCVHDRRVNRTSNGRGAVSALELAELAELDFAAGRPLSGADPAAGPEAPDTVDPERSAVLTLERLLRLVAEADRPVDLAIETKHPTRWAGQVEERLLALLARHPVPGQVRVMSFSARSLQRVHRAAPQLPTVFLMHFALPRHRGGRLPAGVAVAGPSVRMLRRDPGYVARARAAGHPVHVWTVDRPQDVELCVELGVDAIITNRPRTVRAQLADRG